MLFVELHHFFVHLDAILRALVLLLQLLHLGPEGLHSCHVLRALDGERREQGHDHDGEQGDVDRVAGDDRVEEGEDPADRVEKRLEDLPDRGGQ